MRVPRPRWHDQDVTLTPLEALTLDRSDAMAAIYVIDGRGIVAVGLQLLARVEELNLTRVCGKRGPARDRVGKRELQSVARLPFGLLLPERHERRVGFGPGVPMRGRREP